MKALEKIFRYSTSIKIRTVEAMILPMTDYGSKNWTLKEDRKKILILLNFDVGQNSCQDNKQIDH